MCLPWYLEQSMLHMAGAAQCLRPIRIWPKFYAKESWMRKVTDNSARHRDRSAHRQQRWDDCLEITYRMTQM